MNELASVTLGDVIRKLRKDRRWSIRRLETESGIHRMTISKLELNKTNFQHETLDAIARAFDMTGADLEALVSGQPVRRAPEQDLPPSWIEFTRQVVALDRHAQQMFLSLLIFCQDTRRFRDNKLEGHHQSGDGQSHLVAAGGSTAP